MLGQPNFTNLLGKLRLPPPSRSKGLLGGEDLSYVKCLVCGSKLGCVNGTHLKTHGLTVARYKQLYPQAPIISPDVLKKLSFISRHRKVYDSNCKRCGQLFIKRTHNSLHCPRCREEINRNKHRRTHRLYKIKRRNSGVTSDRQLGTFATNYLEVVNNRIHGAVLLEKGISINGSTLFTSQKAICDECGSDLLLIISDHKAYCPECGAELIIARENESYSMPAELCCPQCGLVYPLT